MGSSGNLRIPWIWEQPLFLDMKLMGKLRPSGMKQFAPNQNCGTKSHMKTPPGPPSAPRRDEINLNPSLDTTQACASKPSPLIPNPSSPSAPDGCVGYFPSTSHALALAKPRLSAKLGFFFMVQVLSLSSWDCLQTSKLGVRRFQASPGSVFLEQS